MPTCERPATASCSGGVDVREILTFQAKAETQPICLDGAPRAAVNVGGPQGGIYGHAVARNVAVADFNQDGLPDIAGWMGDNATIEIWLNDPANPGYFNIVRNPDNTPALVSFGPLPGYPTAGFAAADFTGDDIPDLVIHAAQIDQNNPERQYVFPGRGDGTFGAPFVSAPGYGQVHEMVAADLNGDGRLDLVATGNGIGTYIQLGNGDGTFQPAAYYPDGNGLTVLV